MSSRNSPRSTLDVRTRRAERYVASLALAASACGVVLLSPLGAWAACGGSVAAGLVAAGLWQAGWIGSRRRLTGICRLADGSWLLSQDDQIDEQSALSGELSADSRLTGSAIWLRWKTGSRRRRSLLLARGDVAEDELRRLLVRLRIAAAERALPEAGSA